jgi:hypothetical protein
MVADTSEQAIRLVQPAEVNEAAGQAADRAIVVGPGIEARLDARRRLREIGSGPVLIAPHLARFSRQHQ